MSFITKKCFPPAQICYNCKRKNRSLVKEKEEKKKDFARCSGCHFLTYCDSDCQREHLRKVHKNHCKFLGGKKNVDNHPPQTSNTANCLAKGSCKSQSSCHCCPLCIEEKSADATQLGSIKSPKSKCHIFDMINLLKNGGRRSGGGSGVWQDKGRSFEDGDLGYDEVRKLGGLCGRCGENHATRNCSHNKDELRCEYPPCVDKQGHVTKVCHELTKRCRLRVCMDQRGHRAKSHFRPDGFPPYGRDERAADELVRVYEDHKDLLTEEENRCIARYEGRVQRWESAGKPKEKVD